MTNIANLSASLTLSQFEFMNGLKQSETAAMEFSRTIEAQSARANASLGSVGKNIKGANWAGIATQAGYAIQDFTSQLGTRGLAGAIGAVTNNIQAMGASLGPQRAATVAIGAAITGAVLPATIDWLSGAKGINDELQTSIQRYNEMAQSAKRMAQISVTGDTKQAARDLQAQAETADRARQELSGALRDQLKTAAEARDAFHKISFENVGGKAVGNLFGAEWTGRTYWPSKENLRIAGDFQLQTNKAKALQEQMNLLTRESRAAHEELRKITVPGADRAIAAKVIDEAAVKQFDLASKLDQQRRDAAVALAEKAATTYGSEMMKAESKIALERDRLAQLGVSKETMERFEQQAAVEKQRAKIADHERQLSEMAQAAGLSAAQIRGGSGESAIARAIAGTRTEKTAQEEQLKVECEQLKQLELIARFLSRGQAWDLVQKDKNRFLQRPEEPKRPDQIQPNQIRELAKGVNPRKKLGPDFNGRREAPVFGVQERDDKIQREQLAALKGIQKEVAKPKIRVIQLGP